MKRFRLRHSSESDERGFTLLEVMVVVLILGILALIATASYADVSNRSRAAACLSNQRLLSTAVGVYQNANGGTIPATFTLDALSSYVTNWENVHACPLDGTPLTYDALTGRIECPNHSLP